MNSEKLLSLLRDLTFSKTVDTIGTFCKDNPLYFKEIGDKRYLVFNHFNSKKKNNDGFDCWIASYFNEIQVGKKEPISIEQICLSFQLEKDFELIREYLKNT